MLPPKPAVPIVQVGCLLLTTSILIEDKGAMKRVRAGVDPFSTDGPSGRSAIVLRFKIWIMHRAAIRAAIVLALVTLCSFAEGRYERGPDHLDRRMEPWNLDVSIILILLLLIVPELPARRSMQELFLASHAYLTHVGSMTARPQG
jgi:hypothetical protein